MIIIPDIHGRTFWKEAVRDRENDDIVFLGDYLDPYSYEGVTPDNAFENLKDILDFKKEHKENVTLLLGNHDLGYLNPEINICRHDFDRHDEIKALLEDNPEWFRLCTSKEIGGRTFLFSHSFMSSYWLEVCKQVLQFDYDQPSQIAEILNEMYDQRRDDMFELLAMVSEHRGGSDPIGSIVWSDLLEVKLRNAFVPGIYNVFGHTQVKSPAIYSKFACLDCKQAFAISADGKIEAQF